MTTGVLPAGTVASGFEAVRDEFAAVAAAEDDDYAAQLAAYVDGVPVVDLWVGPDLTGDSLTGVYSCTKGAAHLVVALLVQDGALDLDRRVSDYWPEFGVEGKRDTTLRELMAHRAGVVGADRGFTLPELADDRVVAERIAAQRPYWRPGTAFGYHALVICALTGEVVRRVTGRGIAEHYDERIRLPYGIDLHLGLPVDQERRFLTTLPACPDPEVLARYEAEAPGSHSLNGIAYNRNNPLAPDLQSLPNHRIVRERCPVSFGGVGTARGLARMYAAAISGVDGAAPLLTAGTLAEFGQIQSVGVNLVSRRHGAFAVGFTAVGDTYPVLGQGAFGHPGADGSQAFADPRDGLAYGYTRRRFAFPGGAAPENVRLVRAVHAAAAR